MKERFAVVGGDARQLRLGKALEQDGATVFYHGFSRRGEEEPDVEESSLEQCAACDVVILPLPASMDGEHIHMPLGEGQIPLRQVVELARPGTLVVGGKLPPLLWEAAAHREVAVEDYFAREELQVLNAIPTAEGAVQIAMEELGVTLHGTPVLILGYGRIGKLLAHRLQGLGCRVTVAARKCSDRAWIGAFGLQPVDFSQLEKHLSSQLLVCNTVPQQVLGEREISAIPKDGLILDLASKPGGEEEGRRQKFQVDRHGEAGRCHMHRAGGDAT
ncbi:MAG: dipicolinate synthase subunit DpsA [Eubacteriales bacterium]|jgi:dipicolinate synthase subunit A